MISMAELTDDHCYAGYLKRNEISLKCIFDCHGGSQYYKILKKCSLEQKEAYLSIRLFYLGCVCED